MIDIQINSTATNLVSTLIAAVAGWGLATASGAIKSLVTDRKIAKRSAVTLRSELATNQNIAHGWVGTIAVVEGTPSALPRLRLMPLEVGALEVACLNGTFDDVRGGVGEWLRGVLVAVRSANQACAQVNDHHRREDVAALAVQISILRGFLTVAFEELDTLAKTRRPFGKRRDMQALNARFVDLMQTSGRSN